MGQQLMAGGVAYRWHSYQRRHGSEWGIEWFGHEVQVDQLGRAWQRDFDAVVDDFGTLVEVER
jgi:hypothetical protein